MYRIQIAAVGAKSRESKGDIWPSAKGDIHKSTNSRKVVLGDTRFLRTSEMGKTKVLYLGWTCV